MRRRRTSGCSAPRTSLARRSSRHGEVGDAVRRLADEPIDARRRRPAAPTVIVAEDGGYLDRDRPVAPSVRLDRWEAETTHGAGGDPLALVAGEDEIDAVALQRAAPAPTGDGHGRADRARARADLDVARLDGSTAGPWRDGEGRGDLRARGRRCAPDDDHQQQRGDVLHASGPGETRCDPGVSGGLT